MTDSTDPASSSVFIVGMNQKNPFPVDAVGPHEHYIDVLFNRGSESCRDLYDRLTVKPSPTRRNTDDLVCRLAAVRVANVLETNVVCYSTPMSADLRREIHLDGAARGEELFKVLYEILKPKVLIAHGSGTAKKLGKLLGVDLPAPPMAQGEPVSQKCNGTVVFVIPSLAPPGYNRWSRWAPVHLDQVCEMVSACLA